MTLALLYQISRDVKHKSACSNLTCPDSDGLESVGKTGIVADNDLMLFSVSGLLNIYRECNT